MLISNLIWVLFLVKCSDSAKILAITPIPSYSQEIIFKPLLLELSKRHEIVLLTINPIKNVPKTIHQIDLSFTRNDWNNMSKILRKSFSFRTTFNEITNIMNGITEKHFNDPKIKKLLINDSNQHFDLVLTDFLYPIHSVFSYKFKCPLIGLSSTDLPSFYHNFIGDLTTPALYTDLLMPFDGDLSFFERISNAIYYVFNYWYFDYYFYPGQDEIVAKYFGKNYPKILDIQKNVSVVFVNTNPLWNDVRSVMPHVLALTNQIEVKSSEYDKETKLFLDEANNGFIYVDLGDNFDDVDLEILTDVLNELDYQVLWKSNGIHRTKNILKTNKSTSGNVFAHPNILAYMTIINMHFIEEGLRNEIPIIGIPIYPHEFSLMKKLEKNGAGIVLDFPNLNKKELKLSITQVLENKSYNENAKKLSLILNDDLPVDSMSVAIHRIEHTIKFKDRSGNLNRYNLPFYQYLLLDIILFQICITLAPVYLLYIWIYRKRKSTKMKHE